MVLLFAHNLTEDQIQDAKESWGVTGFIKIPNDLMHLWINIPFDKDNLNYFLMPLKKWCNENVNNDDLVFIQGEAGSTFLMVDWFLKNGFRPIHATTKRIYSKKVNKDGLLENTHLFKHEKFRKYVYSI